VLFYVVGKLLTKFYFMALIECYECKNKISSLAESCPQCGAPRQKSDTERAIDRIIASAPKCPVCGSVASSMGGIEGALRGGITGLAKRHRCGGCGHLF